MSKKAIVITSIISGIVAVVTSVVGFIMYTLHAVDSIRIEKVDT